MKINPEISSVINLVKKEDSYQKKTNESDARSEVADVVTVENKAASRTYVDSVEEARVLLSDVMKRMESSSSSPHTLNQYRISQLIS